MSYDTIGLIGRLMRVTILSSGLLVEALLVYAIRAVSNVVFLICHCFGVMNIDSVGEC